jgi:structural maintenance of chromosome 3 (chondroitin sulfate proteoglycan 6)
MHIKQVIISGFRSFRNQGEIEPFSPKHNVIVGRNGSGKSNFFNAIQFVLVAPRFANLRQEDRQLLLHEGAGSSVMSAYVEIVFDNTDGRLSVDSDEVILRRTIGHKKDEFFLNRKRIQKSEVISLLESAGFSKSNPYYIVQQGKVANLCVMRDKDRLNLLKEIAGTTVYEERREESLKILLDTTHKQERIGEVLTFIEERLGELEREKEELKEYDHLDKKRRALQYTLYDKELRKLTGQLEAVEATRGESLVEQQDLFTRLSALQDEVSTGYEGQSVSEA